MPAELFILPARATDASGSPLSGAHLYFYFEGTLTYAPVYADADLTSLLSIPVVADSGGKFVPIYLDPSVAYRAMCYTSDDLTIIYDIDPTSTPSYKSTIPGTPALATLTQLGSQRADVRDWDGMDLSGMNDCASLIRSALAQTALAGVKLEGPAGTITLASPVEAPPGAVLEGPSGLYMSNIGITPSAPATGRLIFNLGHLGKGFTFTGPAGGRSFKSITTRRYQPDPTTAPWAPAPNDWDFYVDGATDVSFDDILLLNPTKGIICTNGGGRFSFNRVWGQPLQTGIQIDVSLDTTRLTNIHFWDFWSSRFPDDEKLEVVKYMIANATAIWSKRNDNPVFMNIFAIFYQYVLRFGNFPGLGGGTTSKAQIHALGADACATAIMLDSDSNGFTGEVHGMYGHGSDSSVLVTYQALIHLLGTNANMKIYGANLTNAHGNAIRVEGAGSSLAVYDPFINIYDMIGIGFPAVEVSNTAYAATLRGDIAISGAMSGAPQYGGAGRIYGQIYRPFTPTVSPSVGTFGAPAQINSAVFSMLDGEAEVIMDFTVPNNGSGSGGLIVSLPVPTNGAVIDVGIGDEVATYGKVLRVHIPPGSDCYILNYDNTYPVTSGSRVVARFKYRY